MSVRHYDSERLCIIKGDCGRHSRLARTQITRRVRPSSSTPYISYYAQVSRACGVVCVFHAHTHVPVPDTFVLVGRSVLQENVHTLASLSNSREYVSVFARPGRGVEEQYASFCREIDGIARTPRHVDAGFLDELMTHYSECVKRQPLTRNQQAIVDYFRKQMGSREVVLGNVNGSVRFQCQNRKPNGKIQSMSGPTIITRSNAYKLTVKGVCRFRRMNPSGMGWNTIRHALHPDYTRLILMHFGARTARIR